MSWRAFDRCRSELHDCRMDKTSWSPFNYEEPFPDYLEVGILSDFLLIISILIV
jgi:hypothetical protein